MSHLGPLSLLETVSVVNNESKSPTFAQSKALSYININKSARMSRVKVHVVSVKTAKSSVQTLPVGCTYPNAIWQIQNDINTLKMDGLSSKHKEGFRL